MSLIREMLAILASFSEGSPDVLYDQISDAVMDECPGLKTRTHSA